MAIPTPPKLDKVELPPEPGLLRGWGRKFEITLLRFALNAYNTIGEPFWNARDAALKYLFQTIEDELQPVIEPILDRIDAMPNLPPEVRRMTEHLRHSEPITFAAIAAALIVSTIVGFAMGMIAPFQRLAAQEVDSYVHSARMSPVEAFAALKRGAITPEEYHNHVSDGGWSERMEEAWQKILAPLVGVGDLGRLRMRGEIGEGEFDAQMTKRGYGTEDIQWAKTLLQVIPPLPDIIRMAVREAFTPDIVAKFQLHAELPGEMVAWAKKQGLSEEWARAYWAAHWELPSLTMGYEMLHRGEVTLEEFKLLVKAHDVSPFWRDKLVAIGYSPYTRVDVRRMYATGVIGKEQVYRTYRDLGYDHERATNLTTFTVALTQETERDLTKTDVLYGYEIGYFSPSETDGLLIAMGYDQAEADYYKAKVDFKRWQKMIKETVKFIKQQYVANQIDQAEVYAQFGALNLPAEQMNRYIREWDVTKKAKTKRLTADRLMKFRVAEVIGDDDFSNEMSGIGYSERYISWYLNYIAKGGK